MSMQSRGINDLLCYGDNRDVVRNLIGCYEKWKDQPSEIVEDLRGYDINTQCESIFSYLIDNTQYKLDTVGKQYIKSPARLLSDGTGDCKSLTMFVSCCLHCLGIKHIIRFVNFDGGGQFTHVYPVAVDGNGKEIVLDACEKDEAGTPIYDYAREFRRKKDFIYNE